jgi:cobalt-zinc-cadmium resistance protein CzcA
VSNEEATRILRQVRQTLMAVPEVRTTVSKAGQPEDGTDPKTISMAEVFVDIKPQEQWRKGLTREKLIDEMDQAVSALPGMEPTFSQPIRDNVLESISQIDGQIVIKIAGDDLVQLKQTAEAIEREIKQVKGVSRAEIDRQGELPQLLINIQREQAARYGLNVGDVQDVIEAALAGKGATTLWDGERRFDVAVRLPQERRSISELAAIPIPRPDGGYVNLGAVSTIEQASGAMNIARELGRRTMAIGIFIKGRDMGSVVADMKQRVNANVKIPENYNVNWSGEFENQERAMQRLSVVVPISLLLIFVLLFEIGGADFAERASGTDRRLCGAVGIRHPLVRVGGDWLHCPVRPSRAQRCGDALGVPATAQCGLLRARCGQGRCSATLAHRADDRHAGGFGPAAHGHEP